MKLLKILCKLRTTGIELGFKPYWQTEADKIVNIDLTAEELISRLKAGKIYRPEKIQTALDNLKLFYEWKKGRK